MKKNQVTVLFYSIIIFTFAVFAGCSAGKESKDTKAEIKTPAAIDKLEYKMEVGKVYKYSMTADSKTTITMMGQEQSFNTKIYAITDIKPVELLANGFSSIMTPDSMKLESDSPQMPDLSGELAKMNGKKFKSIVHKNGAITDIEQVDQFELEEKAKAILNETMDTKARLKNLLLELPDKALKTGDTWIDIKNDSSSKMGGKMQTKTSNEYKVAGKESIGGKDIYKISMITKIEISGTGSQMGNDFTISGKGKSTGDYYFSKDEGLLLNYKVDQAMDMSVDMAAMGMTMPISVITTTDVKLVK
jgi:hypothetical protein